MADRVLQCIETPWAGFMPHYEFIWNDEPGGNADKCDGLSKDDVEEVVMNPDEERISRSTGRPLRGGRTPDGRYAIVIFEWLDEITVYPVTAYEPGERDR